MWLNRPELLEVNYYVTCSIIPPMSHFLLIRRLDDQFRYNIAAWLNFVFQNFEIISKEDLSQYLEAFHPASMS